MSRTVTDLETTATEALAFIEEGESFEFERGLAAVRELARRAVAAEADRDRLQARVTHMEDALIREADKVIRYREALEQIETYRGEPSASHAWDIEMRCIARAALATPDTPPPARTPYDAEWLEYDDDTRAAPDTPPDA
jgi:uncharacterized protein YqgV (UPF0045/DUF77 family)